MFCATFKAFSCGKPCSVLKEQLRAKGPHCNCEDVLMSVGNVAIKAATGTDPIPVFPSLDIIEGWGALQHFQSGKNFLERVKFRAQNLSGCLNKGHKYLGKNAEQETNSCLQGDTKLPTFCMDTSICCASICLLPFQPFQISLLHIF